MSSLTVHGHLPPLAGNLAKYSVNGWKTSRVVEALNLTLILPPLLNLVGPPPLPGSVAIYVIKTSTQVITVPGRTVLFQWARVFLIL